MITSMQLKIHIEYSILSWCFWATHHNHKSEGVFTLGSATKKLGVQNKKDFSMNSEECFLDRETAEIWRKTGKWLHMISNSSFFISTSCDDSACELAAEPQTFDLLRRCACSIALSGIVMSWAATLISNPQNPELLRCQTRSVHPCTHWVPQIHIGRNLRPACS